MSGRLLVEDRSARAVERREYHSDRRNSGRFTVLEYLACQRADSRTTGVLRGFKVIADWAFNSDGTVSPRNGQIEDCFIQSYDDSIKLTQSDSNVEHCVIWQFGNGANFQIGWYPKSISNVHVSDIDVIHSENWWGPNDNAGLLSYTHGPATG